MPTFCPALLSCQGRRVSLHCSQERTALTTSLPALGEASVSVREHRIDFVGTQITLSLFHVYLTVVVSQVKPVALIHTHTSSAIMRRGTCRLRQTTAADTSENHRRSLGSGHSRLRLRPHARPYSCGLWRSETTQVLRLGS